MGRINRRINQRVISKAMTNKLRRIYGTKKRPMYHLGKYIGKLFVEGGKKEVSVKIGNKVLNIKPKPAAIEPPQPVKLKI